MTDTASESTLPRVQGRHRNRALAGRRRVRALQLVSEGLTYQQVADELGYANKGTVHRLVQEELGAQLVESVDELRQTEVARLDALQVVLWDRAMSDDLQAAKVVAWGLPGLVPALRSMFEAVGCVDRSWMRPCPSSASSR